jgi:hypothetical protein
MYACPEWLSRSHLMSQQGGGTQGKLHYPQPPARHHLPTIAVAPKHAPRSLSPFLRSFISRSCASGAYARDIGGHRTTRLSALLGSNHAGGGRTLTPHCEEPGGADGSWTGCEQARRAQEGCRRRWRGAEGRFRKEGRLRVHQEKGGRRVRPHVAQQDIKRGHQREPEEALREPRNLRTCGPPQQAPAAAHRRVSPGLPLIWSQTYIGHVLVSVNPFRDRTFRMRLLV